MSTAAVKQAVRDTEEASCLLDLVADRIAPILDKDHAGDGAALRAAVRAMSNAVNDLLQATADATVTA